MRFGNMAYLGDMDNIDYMGDIEDIDYMGDKCVTTVTTLQSLLALGSKG